MIEFGLGLVLGIALGSGFIPLVVNAFGDAFHAPQPGPSADEVTRARIALRRRINAKRREAGQPEKPELET
jgi:hypothetical protein